MKILITEKIAQAGIDILREHTDVDVELSMKPEELQSVISDYEALIVRSQTKVTKSIIYAAKKLLVIGRAGVGVDNIDIDAATSCGILVVNSPEGNLISTAEHTIAMLMTLARKIPLAHNTLLSGVWDRSFKGCEVRNKILGIIGLGRVGMEVAELAKGLGMIVITYDPMISQTRAERLGIRMVEMEQILTESDFVTIHVPLNSTTKGLIGEPQLRLMKPTAMIINCARGGIVDEAALYKALEGDKLAGAGVDVFTQEPAINNILLRSDKVVATPHLAASTVEAETSAGIDIAEQVITALKGLPTKSPVNAPIISKEAISLLGPYIDVGRKIGLIAAQLIEGHIKSLTIRYEGEIARENTEPLKVAVLSGLLELLTEDRVSMVNVNLIAESRGLRITEEKEDDCENYASMLTIKVETTLGEILVSGFSLRGRTHLTRVNNYWLEIEPSGNYILLTEHKDRPGIVGAVGTILGNASINISQMQVSRGVIQGNKAMMLLCLDEPLTDECHQKIIAIPDMYKVYVVKLSL